MGDQENIAQTAQELTVDVQVGVNLSIEQAAR
jgi:hypothetical protein